MFYILLVIIYISFISLGLPDTLLGSAWPVMYQEFNVPVSYAGVIFMIIAAVATISSLQSDRMTKKLGTGKVTAISVAITAVAIVGFSITHNFYILCLWAIPYGLGAGSIDASLNNYVALNYASRHMSWLHCMWGVGASVGPYIMGYALMSGRGWNMGYRYIAIIMLILAVILFISLPLWKKGSNGSSENEVHVQEKPLTFKQIFHIPGAKEIMITFFCYCALEQTAGLWGSSYLVLHNGLQPEVAAQYASLFFIGITVGRAISGFMTIALKNEQMIRLGQVIILIGILAIFYPGNFSLAPIGLILVGLGCAPIYPCIIHSTPEHFGADKSQAIIGVQMASAYVGTCMMPPIFGLIADHINIAAFPIFLMVILVVMFIMYERMLKRSRSK